MNFYLLRWAAACLVLFAFNTHGAVLYVNVNGTSPVPPYTNWSTAATNIQNAVDTASPGDQILVTDGIYQTGSKPTSDGTTNRVAVTNSVTLQSVNGPSTTIIVGATGVRCIYLTNGAVLSGFTLTNGNAGSGGGVCCASTNIMVSNCILVNNSATLGGGVYSGLLINCTISGNTCALYGGTGGGAYSSILNNCTVSGNATGNMYSGATDGGGAYSCILNNCTISGNSAYGAGAEGGERTAVF